MSKKNTDFTVVVILILPSLPACVRRVTTYKIDDYGATIKVPKTQCF